MNQAEIVPHIEYHRWLVEVYSDKNERESRFWKFKKWESGFFVPDRKVICDIWREVDYWESMNTDEDKNRIKMKIADKYQILHILWNNEIAERVIRVLEYWWINESENDVNNFSVESEFKVLDINIKKLQWRLLKLWYTQIYETMIHDVYNDFLDTEKRLDNTKAIHRNRYKVNDNSFWDPLLTLKKKWKEWEQTLAGYDARICYEREYVIKRLRQALYTFQSIWLQPQREKIKYRWAYKIEREDWVVVKVDIDKYAGIPYIAELEISRVDNKWNGKEFWKEEKDATIVHDILRWLGLSKYKIVWWWSRKLHIEFWVPYSTIFE